MPLDAENLTWVQGFILSVKTQTATWLVAFLIGILTVFSSQITEYIKSALNRADLRAKQHEELANDVGQYIVFAELNAEFIEKNWTTQTTLTDLITQYNKAVITLRTKEFVYQAWLNKYWGETEIGLFKSFMNAVSEFDKVLHALNDEIEKVNITQLSQRIDPDRAADASVKLKPAVEKIRQHGRDFLVALI